MTKIQKIREKRLKKTSGSQNDITTQAEKVFDWLLDLIDDDTEREFFDSIEVDLFEDLCTIKITTLSGKCEFDNFFLQYNVGEFFSTLRKTIEQEDEFRVIPNLEDTSYDSKCTLFEIVIE